MTDYFQVSTTAASREAAINLVRSAVEGRLAACGQVLGPVVSVFWHKGELGEAEEWQVFLKTTAAKYPELEAHLIDRHPWDNPEVTAWPLAAGSATFLEWVTRSTS
ncbi:divalent-cation tolerance protein CutA [Planotetraspora sp. GP83]|uniref:divalent-cation tolerance protein CutA n=1 Tax=Planotetraspora sp. GP83 TaxID=3156264 RepID=UPI0035131AAB